ncbi:MAG: ThuA domain-containing protein [Bacteroidales bacterium]|nr:ThuA domain-containing protein [Bacteroidales bacterium]
MSVIDYHPDTRVLVSVKGHPYPRDAFFGMLESLPGMTFTGVEQPASQAFLSPAAAADWDVFLFYDMPGIDFSTQPPRLVAPPAALMEGFTALLEQGCGFVFLHHAIAAWPLWPEYADIVGGRFLYLPGELKGRPRLDSGYRHEVDYRARVVADHPLTDGVERDFALTDELYLYEVFEEDVIPLLRSDYCFDRDHFYSAAEAGRGRMYSNDGWDHPPGSDLLGWVKHYRNSPIVYLQPGDGEAAYDSPHFRQLLGNALTWVASDEARRWARARNGEA